MTVRRLLDRKGRSVATARCDETIQNAMDQLELDEVSAIVVTDTKGKIEGIVSAGDILRALNRDGSACLSRPVSEIMQTEVITCDISEPLSTIFEIMDTNTIRHVPIIDGGRLCGIINTLDVVQHRVHETALEAEALKNYVAGRT